MLEKLIARIVDISRRAGFGLVAALLLLAVLAGQYVVHNFAINTDVTSLLSEKTTWRQNEIAVSKAFPQRDDLLVIVIDGTSSAGANAAAQALASAMQPRNDLFRSVKRPEVNAYFSKNGLLLLPFDELSLVTEQLIKAQPLLGSLNADPTPRGLFNMLGLMLDGSAAGQLSLADMTPLFKRAHESFSRPDRWAYMMEPEVPGKFELRRFILAQPVMDYTALSPAARASDFIRAFIKEKNLEETHGVRIRLTGPVALADEEFASISEGMVGATMGSILLILLLLFLALHSWRLIVPIFIVLAVGLIVTTAFALLTVKSLNLISVAFAVMFTGIAVDFGIQFGVRARDVRFHEPDFAQALKRTGSLVAVPLLLAALGTAAGFLSFTPTSYRGVAELGLIAGTGMIIAFILNITLLPALLAITKPGAESESAGYKWAAPLDDFLEKNRNAVLVFFAALFIAASIAAFFIRFDFDPLNLKNPKTESVSTMLELVEDPDSNPYTVDILAPNIDAAETLAIKIRALPEVEKAMTLQSFVPDEQEQKIALINEVTNLLTPALQPAPAQATNAATQKQAAQTLLEKMRATQNLPPEAERFKVNLQNFIAASDAVIEQQTKSFTDFVSNALGDMRARLTPHTITLTDIPESLKRDWVAADGSARIEVTPKDHPRDQAMLIKFVAAIRAVTPDATGAPVSIQESAATIKQAFIEAGIYAVIAIFFLLFLTLGPSFSTASLHGSSPHRRGDIFIQSAFAGMTERLTNTLYVLAPLILAGVLTLGTATLINLPINFANIIALPLLLGLGVSYSIYFVVYWRQGFDKPLQSGMARAVLFSAATAFVAFGSLSLSNHPGTASMGLLLSLSLFYVLFTTLFFLPCLLRRNS